MLSGGLDRIDTMDLLPFQETTTDITATITSFGQEMHFQNNTQNQNPQAFQHHQNNSNYHPHQLQQQLSGGGAQCNNFYAVSPDHLDATPDLNDYDSEARFEVGVPMDEKEKKLWYYDATTKRLFVKGDQELTAQVSCHSHNSRLFVRLMPVYTSLADVRKPVNRCPNHKDQCKTGHREHLVHCHNEGAQYMGKETGETFGERLSVLIPLRKSQQPRQYAEKINEEIVFSITCLNSCSGISRRPTALIFTLENEHMEILGRTVMNFRACTSPKRDFDNDRKKRGAPLEETSGPSAKRPMILKNPDGSMTTMVKLESDTNTQSSQESGPLNSPSPSGETLITISLPSKELSLKILQLTQDCLAGETIRNNPVHQKYFKQIRKQIDEVTKDLQKQKLT